MEGIGEEEILISTSSKFSVVQGELNELHWQYNIFVIFVKSSQTTA